MKIMTQAIGGHGKPAPRVVKAHSLRTHADNKALAQVFNFKPMLGMKHVLQCSAESGPETTSDFRQAKS